MGSDLPVVALDTIMANRVVLRGMTTLRNRDQALADHFLKAAGVAAIWIGQDGFIGADDLARVRPEPDRIVYCCPRGAHFVLAYRLQLWKQDQFAASTTSIAERLEELAFEAGVGLTKHSVATDRALQAVIMVEAKIEVLKQAGDLASVNAAFKAARAANPSIRFGDFMHAKKTELLEALVRHGGGLREDAV